MKGDEKYLAQLINARKMLCIIYPNLKPADDIEAVRRRIEQVRNNGPAIKGKQYPKHTKRVKRKILPRRTSHAIAQKGKSGPEEYYEDLLMLADWNMFAWRNYQDKLTNYATVLMACTNSEFAEYPYDGITLKRAAQAGCMILKMIAPTNILAPLPNVSNMVQRIVTHRTKYSTNQIEAIMHNLTDLREGNHANN